jgi:hypothetical protein
MLRISGKDGLYGKPPKQSVVPLSRWLQAPLEADCSLNEGWFMGSRQVQRTVKRGVGLAGVGSKCWIEPFCGDMQKPPSTWRPGDKTP